jgi:integrase
LATKQTARLTDKLLSAWRDFSMTGMCWDLDVRGFRVRIGSKRISFSFFMQHRFRGKRSTTCRALGTWPSVTVTDARKAALRIAGEIARSGPGPGQRDATKFEDAFGRYLEHCRAQSDRRGKAPLWAVNVAKLGKVILPMWGKWALLEMSNSPGPVADWHEQVTRERGAVTANRCIQIIRAAYRRAARLDRSLPAALPTSAVTMNVEHARQVGIENWSAWRAEWEAIPSPTRRAFHILNLLLGCRPGELQRLRWRDVNVKARTLTLVKGKSGLDVAVPLSLPIVQGLRMARGSRSRGQVRCEWVFPSPKGGHIARGNDGLSIAGHGLRHTFRLVAVEAGADELLTGFLMSHAPSGISQKYIPMMMLREGPAMRKAQAAISARIMSLLGPSFFVCEAPHRPGPAR